MKCVVSVLFVACLLVAGCEKKKEEPKVRITGPGIDIRVDGNGADVTSPGGNIKVDKR